MSLPEFSNIALKAILERFFETSFNAIVITTVDRGRDIIYANPRFCEMTGYTLEELVGRSPALLQGPKTNRAIIRRMSECLDKGEPFHGATTNYRKNGEPYPVEWTISPIHDEHGKITHFISIQKDLSHLREIVGRLKQTNQHFRRFLRDIVQRMDTETLPELSSLVANEKPALTAELLENSALYTPELRSDENIELFGDTEFFDCDNGMAGLLGDEVQHERISAAAYCRDLTVNIEIGELQHRIEETRDKLDLLEFSSNVRNELQEIGQNLQDMANEIFYLEEFVGISSALSELARQTLKQAGGELSPVMVEIYHALLADLQTWVKAIFLEQSAPDIHEYDASIITAAKQLLIFMK